MPSAPPPSALDPDDAWEHAIEDELARGGHALVIAFATTFAEGRARVAPHAEAAPPLLTPPRVPDVPIVETTLRLENNEPNEPAPHLPAPPEPAAFPLLRVKRRLDPPRGWLARLVARLLGARAVR